MKRHISISQDSSLKMVLVIVGLFIMTWVTIGCDDLGLSPGGQSPAAMPSLPASSGSHTWIEFPLDGSSLPMGPVTLVVYAADTQGVSQIDVRMNGQALPSGAPRPLTADGSSRLVRLDLPWQPPAEGTYFFQAAGQGSSGGPGQSTMITFCVGACQGATPGVPTGTPTPDLTTTPLTTGTPTLTPVTSITSQAPVQIEFWAAPPYVNAGQCAQINWNVTGAKSLTLNGAAVNSSGNQQACLCETTNYTLRVFKPDNTYEDRFLTVDVYGSCEAPVTEAPPLPQDTDGPIISGGGLVWESCQFYGQASFSDPSGVSSGSFSYNLNGEGWNTISMNEAGGETWISSAGVPIDTFSTPTGSIQFRFEATDSLGNSASSGTGTYTYMGCGG